MAIKISAKGETLADCYKALGFAADSLQTAPIEAVIEEARSRLRPQGLSLNIEAAEEPAAELEAEGVKYEEERSEKQSPEEKPKRGPGRPPTKLKEAAKSNGRGEESPKESKPVSEGFKQGELAAPAGPPADDVNRKRVVTALEAYAATHGGQVAARAVMQEVTGVSRLTDVKPEQYPKLWTRLER